MSSSNILTIQKCLPTVIGEQTDVFKSSNKSWMYMGHRLNTLAPVCRPTIYDEQLEFTCTLLLTMDICGLLSMELPHKQKRLPIPKKTCRSFWCVNLFPHTACQQLAYCILFINMKQWKENSYNSSGSIYRCEVLYKQTNYERNDSLIP